MNMPSATICLLIAATTLPSARAAISVTFVGNLGSSVTVADNGPLDENPAPWLISVGGIGGTPLVLDGYSFARHQTEGGTHYFNSFTGEISGTGTGKIAVYTSLSSLYAPPDSTATADLSASFRFTPPMFDRSAAIVTARSYLDISPPSTTPSGTLIGSSVPRLIDASSFTPAPSAASLAYGWTGQIGLESFSFNFLTEADNLSAGVVNTLSMTGSAQINVTPAPEPAGVLLPVAAFSAAITVRRRRRA